MKKKGLIVAVVIVGILLAGMLGAELWLRSTIRQEIERALGADGATVELGHVAVSLPRRSVSVRDVRVRAQNNDVARRGFTIVSLDVAVGNITARGVGYKRVGDKPALSVDRLIVETPRATFVTKSGEAPGVDTLPPPGAAETPEDRRVIFAGKLYSLSVGEVSVRGAALEHVRWLAEGGMTRLTVDGGDLSVRDITLDSPPAEVRLKVDSIVYGFGAGSKVVRADGLALETATGTLSIEGFALVPQFSREEFASRSENHEDWTRIAVGGINCTGVDYARLSAERTIAIDSVSLASADVASYKNRNVFQRPRAKQMLYQTVQRLPVPVDVGVLAFENVDVRYDELAAGGTAPAEVTLAGCSGTATNITNIAAGHERFMMIECDATFMHSGAVQAKFLLPVSAADDRWELSGRLGPTDMAAFNPALEPLMNMKITSGEIRSLDFNIAGTLDRSHSKITMEYNDLQVVVLDRHDHTRTRKLLTFLAGDLLIRPDNPSGDGRGRLREGEGEHTRDPERSMWNYIWHSLLPAVLKTVI